MAQNNPYQNAQYQAPVGPAPTNSGKRSSGLGIASIILGPLGCCCCGVTTLVGLILGIVGVCKNKKDITAIIGLILCALIVGYFIFDFIYIFNNPEALQATFDEFNRQFAAQGSDIVVSNPFAF